ncbi:TetR/AcrR family transcriptional regulator [Microbacterium sp. X-17]|uniref:TetR/AcrR family transcriptional regulator n=1 Tax=Microbacterium sp. X-17 TaxID=3144404 RepID=UPI0031F5167D
MTLELVLERGFDDVTLVEISDAAGVSRSTYLRYVGSKAEAVVGGLMSVGNQIAQRLRERPSDESDWIALRRAFDAITEAHGTNAQRLLQLVESVRTNPGLSGSLALQRDQWRDVIAEAAVARRPETSPRQAQARAAAALAALDVAVIEWSDSSGRERFEAALDAAFDAVGTASNH